MGIWVAVEVGVGTAVAAGRVRVGVVEAVGMIVGGFVGLSVTVGKGIGVAAAVTVIVTTA